MMDEVVCFDMDNATVVHCLARPGTSLSESLLSLSEQISTLAASRRISLSGQHLPGVDYEWADALSRFKGSSVEWTLKRGLFAKLCRKWGTPHVDLFAYKISARLPTFLSRRVRTSAGGPDSFTEDWNRWAFLYLFPPPCTSILLRVVHRLRSYEGKVTLIAPWWPAQPWFAELHQWCPFPLPLKRALLRGCVRACSFPRWRFTRGISPGLPRESFSSECC